MELTVKDRLILLGILGPQAGNIATLRIVQKLRDDLSFNEQEHKDLEIEMQGGMIRWNDQVQLVKDVDIGPVAHKVIVDALKEMSAREQLHLEHLTILDKFPEVEAGGKKAKKR